MSKTWRERQVQTLRPLNPRQPAASGVVQAWIPVPAPPFRGLVEHGPQRRGIGGAAGVLAGVGGAGWHDGMGMRLLGELNAYLRSRFVSQKFVAYIAQFNKQDMTLLADLMQSGKITPVIDRTYKLNETADALRYLEQGHARGKIVIKLESR